MKLEVKKLHDKARLPAFAHASDAGMDLCASETITILPGERAQIPTGIAFAIPEGFVGLIWDKSGISQKNGLKSLGGVIDAGYRGEVFVGLYNTSDTAHAFNVGDKVAQILIQKIEQPEIIEVTELGQTERGEGAFGSTGI